jgi:hypothetical protein
MSSACRTVLAPAGGSEENTAEDDAEPDIGEDDRKGEDNDDEVGCAGILRRTPFLASRDESLKDVETVLTVAAWKGRHGMGR